MDLNVFTCTARLTTDVDLTYTKAGKAMARFRFAVNGGKAKDKDATLFLSATAWDKAAEIAHARLAKGHRVGLTGRLEPNEWETKDGAKRSEVRLVVFSLVFLEPKAPATGEDYQ